MSKWVEFKSYALAPKRITGAWHVVAKGGSDVLGSIRWYAPWRRYAFYPFGRTLYEPTCLRDIAAFIDEQMAARKKPA